MRSGARSNTALFRTRDSHEAHVPTVQDAPRETPRLSRAQQDTRRTRGPAQPACARASAPRVVAVVAAAQKRFGLDAARRLRRKAQFERLLREGERRALGGYTFYLQRRADGRPRLGVLNSRKHTAAAADRNRIHRSIRAALSLAQENLGALD